MMKEKNKILFHVIRSYAVWYVINPYQVVCQKFEFHRTATCHTHELVAPDFLL